MSAQARFAPDAGTPAACAAPTLMQLQGPALQALSAKSESCAAWQVVDLRVHDAINTLFEARLRVAHPELPRDLRPMLGRELRLRLDVGGDPQPGVRWWCGVVCELESLGMPAAPGRFVAHLLPRVLLGDAALAAPDEARRTRRFARRVMAGAAALAASAAAWSLLETSYARSRDELDRLAQGGASLQQHIEQASRQSAAARDAAWQPVLASAQQFASDARSASDAWPFAASALPPLRSSADALVLRLQQTLVVPALVDRMRAVLLEAMQRDDSETVFETLQAYLMLHDAAQFDSARLGAWARRHAAAPGLAQALAYAAGVLREAGPSDPVLLRQAREWLVRIPRADRLWQHARRILGDGSRPPPFTLLALRSGETGIAFRRASGRGLSEGVPGWYRPQTWSTLLQPHLQQLALQAAAEDRQVLGAAAGEASAQVLQAELAHAYWQEYARQWSAFLGDVRVQPRPAVSAQLSLLHAMAAQDSPLLDLVHRAWAELEPLAAQPDVDTDPVARALLQLRALGQGDADATRQLQGDLDAYYTAASMAATAIAAGQPAGAEFDQATARLRARAGTLPMPLAQVLGGLAGDTSGSLLGAGNSVAKTEAEPVYAQIAGAFREQVAQVCARTLAGRFPLRGDGPDADLDDFTAFVGPGGSAENFFHAYLEPWVDTSRRPWRYRSSPPAGDLSGPAAGLSPAAMQELLGMLRQRGPDPDAFARIARLRSALWRNGATAPHWNFQLSVPSLDPAVGMLRLETGGQSMRYAHGPVQSWAAAWPGPQPGAGARLRLEPVDGSAAWEVSARGPWAWMRLLAQGRRQPGSGSGSDLAFGPTGHRAVVHLGSADPDPWAPGGLQGFACPR